MVPKISFSFDVHPLVSGRKLVLAGIPIEHDKGLLGHSDGDVVLHALTDALLSAGGLPDIGTLFSRHRPSLQG
jgi:2-C-methyl-D-erythritol 2,4-cyclodiphosphate synthase